MDASVAPEITATEKHSRRVRDCRGGSRWPVLRRLYQEVEVVTVWGKNLTNIADEAMDAYDGCGEETDGNEVGTFPMFREHEQPQRAMGRRGTTCYVCFCSFIVLSYSNTSFPPAVGIEHDIPVN